MLRPPAAAALKRLSELRAFTCDPRRRQAAKELLEQHPVSGGVMGGGGCGNPSTSLRERWERDDLGVLCAAAQEVRRRHESYFLVTEAEREPQEQLEFGEDELFFVMPESAQLDAAAVKKRCGLRVAPARPPSRSHWSLPPQALVLRASRRFASVRPLPPRPCLSVH